MNQRAPLVDSLVALVLALTATADARATVVTIGPLDSYGVFSVFTGDVVNMNGGSVVLFDLQGGVVNMYGGSVHLFDLQGGAVNMYGGTLEGLNTDFSPGSIDVYGGTLSGIYFGGYSNAAARLHVQSASFNSVPISLTLNQAVGLPSPSAGTIAGVLQDGSAFSIGVDPGSFRPTVSLILSAVPESTMLGPVGIASVLLIGALQKRRAPRLA